MKFTFLVTCAVAAFFSVTMFFTMPVFFVFFFITGKHGDNVCHRGMSESSQIEMDDDECAEEYPEKHMDHVSDLYPPDQIHERPEEGGVPEEEARYDLDRYEGCHNHEIRHLLHWVELIIKC